VLTEDRTSALMTAPERQKLDSLLRQRVQAQKCCNKQSSLEMRPNSDHQCPAMSQYPVNCHQQRQHHCRARDSQQGYNNSA